MNSIQLLDFLSENGYHHFPESYREPFLRTVKSENGVVIHEIAVNVFLSSDGEFIMADAPSPGDMGQVGNIFGTVNDFLLLHKAYMQFKRQGVLDESMRLDFCLVLIRLFFNEYATVAIKCDEKFCREFNLLFDIVIELHKFNDEILSPVIKDRISQLVYSVAKPVYGKLRKKGYDDGLGGIPDLCEPGVEYRRCKKTNPLVSMPGFVNLFSDYSKINLPNCSGR